MTQETLEKAKQNRKEREEKGIQLTEVNRLFDKLSDDKIIWLDMNSNNNNRIMPTVNECRHLLRIMRDRLCAEIGDLEREFESL